MPKTRLFSALLCLMSATTFAAERARIVNRPAAPQVTLNGQVTDLTDSRPVVEVEISGQGRFTRSDSEGKFALQVSQGLPVTLTFSRSGYESKTETFTLSGTANRTFQLRSLPTARIVTRAGVTHVVDADTVEFGYAIPFLGIRRAPKANMCRAGGQKFELERAQLVRIEGPSVTTTDAACCSKGPVNGAVFEQRDGQRFTAYFVDSCEQPHMQLFARDHATWQLLFVEFSDLAEAVLP